jgi:YidC/Oxa1 family membrane protein insertase
MRLLPFGTVVAAAVLPLATGLYLATTTLWTLLERRHLQRRWPQPVPAAAAAR